MVKGLEINDSKNSLCGNSACAESMKNHIKTTLETLENEKITDEKSYLNGFLQKVLNVKTEYLI